MNERCSCGTVLVEGALFCHRCGKPQREDLIEAAEASVPPPAAPSVDAVVQAEVDRALLETLYQRRATRAALSSAVLAFLAISIFAQVLGVGAVIFALILAGVLTVQLYQRGLTPPPPVTTRFGARIGWTTGVFSFLLLLVQMTLGILLSRGSFRDTIVKQFEEQAAGNPALTEFTQFLATNSGLVTVLATMMVFVFLICTVLTTLGGALGAQLAAKRT